MNETIIEQPQNPVDEIIEEINSVVDDSSSQNLDNDSPLTEEEQAILDQAVEEAHQEIPVNSETLLVDEATSRFSSAVWYNKIQEKVIILAGIGGIGSWLALLLARLKPASMFIYDDDIVEEANMSGQLYSQSDINTLKVVALASMIRNYANYNNDFAVDEKFTDECDASDIMICGFDNMEARNIFFNKWVDHVQAKTERERKNCLFIDGRIKC